MSEAAERGEHPVGLAAVRFIALTGFRLNEAQMLKREWVDEKAGVVRFPDTKSDSQIRVIGPAAAEVIIAQGDPGGTGYAFRSDWGDTHFKQVPDVLVRLCKAARLEHVTAHTLRHTFASVAGDLGFSEIPIAGLLGYGKRGVT
jgi:integrase